MRRLPPSFTLRLGFIATVFRFIAGSWTGCYKVEKKKNTIGHCEFKCENISKMNFEWVEWCRYQGCFCVWMKPKCRECAPRKRPRGAPSWHRCATSCSCYNSSSSRKWAVRPWRNPLAFHNCPPEIETIQVECTKLMIYCFYLPVNELVEQYQININQSTN